MRSGPARIRHAGLWTGIHNKGALKIVAFPQRSLNDPLKQVWSEGGSRVGCVPAVGSCGLTASAMSMYPTEGHRKTALTSLIMTWLCSSGRLTLPSVYRGNYRHSTILYLLNRVCAFVSSWCGVFFSILGFFCLVAALLGFNCSACHHSHLCPGEGIPVGEVFSSRRQNL